MTEHCFVPGVVDWAHQWRR